MTLAEANRKYFDLITDTYDTKPFFRKVTQQVTDSLQARLDWVGIPFTNTGTSSDAEHVRLLDYACGTGTMSRIYGPYVTVTRGIDISPKMVANFNSRARDVGLSEATISAIEGNLFDKKDPSPTDLSGSEWKNFDLATVGFGFHHFEDVVHAARQLKERLRPGGALVITDFLEGGDIKADENGDPIPESEGDHAQHHHHHHSHGEHTHGQQQDHHHHHSHGSKEADTDDPSIKFREQMNASVVVPHFTLEHVKNIFTEAGLVDVDVVTMEKRVYMEFGGQRLWRTILFAKGKRPLEEKSEL